MTLAQNACTPQRGNAALRCTGILTDPCLVVEGRVRNSDIPICHGSPRLGGAPAPSCANTGGPLIAYAKWSVATYSKSHQDPSQVVSLLQSKGLSIPDLGNAEALISAVGFERLRIYILARRDVAQQNKPFQNGVTFDDIEKLYNLDKELRLTAFDSCEVFETTFRNAMSENLTRKYGSHPYQSSVFIDSKRASDSLRTIADTYLKNVKKDARAKHYIETYSDPMLPPMWRLKEFFTLGNAAFVYRSLRASDRVAVARRMGLQVSTPDVFDNWLAAINDLRNACAHHDRIFNRVFQKTLSRYKKQSIPSIGSESRLGGLLEILDFMNGHVGMPTNSVSRARNLIGSNSAARLGEAGW